MTEEKQIIEEIALAICESRGVKEVDSCLKCIRHEECLYYEIACAVYNADYRRQSEVIDDFVKRLLDAFPEANRDACCPAIYYDDYRYIIEEMAEQVKGGAE